MKIMPLPFVVCNSALGNCSSGAGISTATAVNAGIGVDYKLRIALRDRSSGASTLTSATTHTGIADDIGHGEHLQNKYDVILAQILKNAIPVSLKNWPYPVNLWVYFFQSENHTVSAGRGK
jgi:hypothetical protein